MDAYKASEEVGATDELSEEVLGTDTASGDVGGTDNAAEKVEEVDKASEEDAKEGIDIDNFEGEVVREDQGEKVEEVFFFFFFSAFIVMPSELLFIEELGVKDSAMGPKADGIDINNFIGKIVRKDQGENFFEYHS